MEIHYKSLHHHVRPIKSYIFWKLMTPIIHWRSGMTMTMAITHTQIWSAWKTIMYYIFEIHGGQGYQIWHSGVSNGKYINTQIHKYANTQTQSPWKTQHVLYWKAGPGGPRISNMTSDPDPMKTDPTTTKTTTAKTNTTKTMTTKTVATKTFWIK